ncbi:T9SS type A sorting domain-containing protein [Flavobacterium cellulosilyticum]|uniref:T9SS type A sorting domain-containing protein n=2 Tax=Flavobacterium cellulosilyticum TaxID=2541731 RepID=A0A4V6PFB8_9FLAO|nr:T9SS type A sorting domain-containing protein [Flavobacterium cellulosilyticum]
MNLTYSRFCILTSLVLFGNLFSSKAQVTLNADGPGNTYELINSVFAPGYNVVEDPECVHSSFGRHIAEVYDTELSKNVFEFYIHVTPDNDRCINFDRQRVEIKTYNASPDNLKATLGETVTYKWRFKIPVGFQPSSNFTHIHQVKAVGGDDGNPIFTLTLRKGSPNKLELIYVKDDFSGTTKYANLNLSLFEGIWVEATETIKIAASGTYDITIKRVDNGVTLLNYSNSNIATIRLGTVDNSFIRPKWGIYRSLLNEASLRDDSIRFSDFSITEGTLSTEEFPSNNEDIVLFPNPVDDNLEISEEIRNNYDSIRIFNTNGKLILSQQLSTSNLNLSHLSPGLYFVKFTSNGLESKAVKLLKK